LKYEPWIFIDEYGIAGGAGRSGGARVPQGIPDGSARDRPAVAVARDAGAWTHSAAPPGIKDAVEKLLADGVDEVCLLPMFPHYAMATTGSCTAGVKAAIKGRASLRVGQPFFDEPTFIQPLAESLAEVGEHILFTFHGLPERHLRKDARTADYRINCMETARLIAAAAGIPEERYTVSFQSRIGRAKWLEPYTEETLRQLPAAGKNRLAVICPSFFCDCLETLEEIEIRGKEAFLEAGGESFRMIPCLNHSPAAFHCLETLMANAGNWNEA
jgi:ferrochelatase